VPQLAGDEHVTTHPLTGPNETQLLPAGQTPAHTSLQTPPSPPPRLKQLNGLPHCNPAPGLQYASTPRPASLPASVAEAVHALAVQVCEDEHAAHTAPFFPQAELSVPPLHDPVESQQPVQVVLSHFLLEPQAARSTAEHTAEKASQRIRDLLEGDGILSLRPAAFPAPRRHPRHG
jgi:hypothetical protein